MERVFWESTLSCVIKGLKKSKPNGWPSSVFTSSVIQNKSSAQSLSWPLCLLSVLLQYVSFSSCPLSAVVVFVQLSQLLAYFQVVSLPKDDKGACCRRWMQPGGQTRGDGHLCSELNGSCSVICLLYYWDGRHVVMSAAYFPLGSGRPSQLRQVPAS